MTIHGVAARGPFRQSRRCDASIKYRQVIERPTDHEMARHVLVASVDHDSQSAKGDVAAAEDVIETS